MQTNITHSCGHRTTVQLYGTNSHGERDRKAAWLATVPCPACAKVERGEERAELNKQTAQDAAANDWPTLTGTERQIPWATAWWIGNQDRVTRALAAELSPEGRKTLTALEAQR